MVRDAWIFCSTPLNFARRSSADEPFVDMFFLPDACPMLKNELYRDTYVETDGVWSFVDFFEPPRRMDIFAVDTVFDFSVPHIRIDESEFKEGSLGSVRGFDLSSTSASVCTTGCSAVLSTTMASPLADDNDAPRRAFKMVSRSSRALVRTTGGTRDVGNIASSPAISFGGRSANWNIWWLGRTYLRHPHIDCSLFRRVQGMKKQGRTLCSRLPLEQLYLSMHALRDTLSPVRCPLIAELPYSIS